MVDNKLKWTYRVHSEYEKYKFDESETITAEIKALRHMEVDGLNHESNLLASEHFMSTLLRPSFKVLPTPSSSNPRRL